MKKINFTKEQEIINLYKKELLSMGKIKKMYHIGYSTIKRIFKENNVKPNHIRDYQQKKKWCPVKIKFTEEQKEDICKMSNEDLCSAKKIGKIFDVSESPIRRILKEKGIDLKLTHLKKISKATKGMKFTEEHKINIGKSLKGITKEGHEWNEESKEKLRQKRIGENNPMYNKRGDLSPAWLGGISFEPYGIEFNNNLKEKIRGRDNFTCQECGKTQEELNRKLGIHHVDYNKKNNNPLNLISLCVHCHIKTNSNREHWKRYFQNIMTIREINNPDNMLIFNSETKGLIGVQKI